MYWVNYYHPVFSGTLIVGLTLLVSVIGLLLLRDTIHHFFKITSETNEVINGFFLEAA